MRIIIKSNKEGLLDAPSIEINIFSKPVSVSIEYAQQDNEATIIIKCDYNITHDIVIPYNDSRQKKFIVSKCSELCSKIAEELAVITVDFTMYNKELYAEREKEREILFRG